jgi:hypothetical protein
MTLMTNDERAQLESRLLELYRAKLAAGEPLALTSGDDAGALELFGRAAGFGGNIALILKLASAVEQLINAGAPANTPDGVAQRLGVLADMLAVIAERTATTVDNSLADLMRKAAKNPDACKILASVVALVTQLSIAKPAQPDAPTTVVPPAGPDFGFPAQ